MNIASRNRTINSHLDYLKNQVLEAEKRLFKKDIKVTSENLKNELFGAAETKRMLNPNLPRPQQQNKRIGWQRIRTRNIRTL